MTNVRFDDLYRNGEIQVFENGDKLLQRPLIKVEASLTDSYYKVKDLDNLPLIAYKSYEGTIENASKYWWVIADANNIENPLDLSKLVGKSILIPNIQKFQLNL
jgi:hypothetical protein